MAARRSDERGGPKPAGPTSAGSQERKDSREFVSEAEEILERMLEDLSELHEQRHAAGEVDPDLVNRIFRSAHSLKGLAGMFGLDAISELSHRLEDILDAMRLGRIQLDSPVVDLLDDGVALLVTLMTSLEADGGCTDEGEADTHRFIERIEAAMQAPEPALADELEGLDIDPSLLRALTEYEEHRLRESIRRGRHISMVDSTFEIMAFEEGLGDLSAAVREVGEVVSTLPSPGDAPESQIRFSLLVATDVATDRLRARLELPDAAVQMVRAAAPGASAESGESRSSDRGVAPHLPPEATKEAASGEGDTHPSRTEAPEIESLRSISDTVRVDIRKLDELMNLVGELVIQRNAIASVATRLASDAGTSRIGGELGKTSKMLDRKLKELQSGVLDVRMVPLRQVFEKISRVVRRLRRDLDKDVELDFKGADTELDKFIVEQLVDPLVHIVRNSFDHAIESSDERTAAGKSVNGTIGVHAFQRGNHVVIEVRDDGRGMDIEAIRAKAIERGLATPAELQKLSEKDLLTLVFEPGFSTCESVSETSGRGVGMDVVRSNLAEMGGMVEIQSTPGRGTAVILTLPITLAIIQALIVRVGTERFAIPLNSVLETLVVEPNQVQRSEDREILNLRGEPLLLRRLGEEFAIDACGRDERQFVVVLGMGEHRIGLMVDHLEGQQDTVIKPIKGPVQQIRGIAGATELGDQGAILVIDVSTLVADAVRRREAV